MVNYREDLARKITELSKLVGGHLHRNVHLPGTMWYYFEQHCDKFWHVHGFVPKLISPIAGEKRVWGMYVESCNIQFWHVYACKLTLCYCRLSIREGFMQLNVVIHCFRSPLCRYSLLCWPLWRCQWSCECHCELDTMMETVVMSISSTLPPMLPRPHMGDFWTSPLPESHNMNWPHMGDLSLPVLHSMNGLVSWQAMSTTLQYVVSTVGVWWGMRVNHW